MGNALARDLIRESYDVPSWALKYHSSRTEAHEWLELLAKARTQMESVWVNPDSKAMMESFEVMKALGVSGPPIVDRSSDQVVNIGLYDFILKYSLFDNDELFKSIRFYVDDPFACITTKSTIHYMVPAINDGMAGYVIFFDERAAEFARLYVVRFCPHVKLDLQNRDNPLYLNSAHIPPLSDLLGFTRYGSPKVQAPLNSIKDSFAIQSLRAWPHLDDLTCATAAHASAMRRQELGERLYPLVAARVDARRVAHDQRAHLREQPARNGAIFSHVRFELAIMPHAHTRLVKFLDRPLPRRVRLQPLSDHAARLEFCGLESPLDGPEKVGELTERTLFVRLDVQIGLIRLLSLCRVHHCINGRLAELQVQSG